ncbi:MAG: hydroxyisourate hydrolase [Planctomycetes bacterium]|nr:hydroxyisourate hydrolase [Planctomycetota bacterium]
MSVWTTPPRFPVGVVGHAALIVLVTGCQARPGRVVAPPLDPAAVAAALVARVDTDKSGRLSTPELTAAPGLLRVAAAIDVNADGELSADECAARIGQWQALRVGRVACSFVVTRAGRPLANVNVELVPEPEFSVLPTAKGRTDASGRVTPIATGDLPGVAPGPYRVVVGPPQSPTSATGASSSAGLLVAPDDPGLMSLVVEVGPQRP